MRSEQEIRADLERKGERDAAFRAKIEAGQCRHLLDATGESQFITSRLVADVPDLLHRAEAAESALAQLREQIAAGIEAELDARRTPPHLDGPHREGIFVGLNLAHRIITGVPDVTEDELHRYPTARLSAPSTVTPPETDERPARPQLHPNVVKERATVALDGTAGPSTPVDEPERPLILHDEHFPECADEIARLRGVIDSVREMHKPNFMSPYGRHYGCAECINRLDDNCRTFKALTLAAVLPVQTGPLQELSQRGWTAPPVAATTHNIQYQRALHPPVEPAALIAFRLADGELFGSVNAFIDTALDYRDLGSSDEEVRPVILNILPRWLRDLADRIEAEGRDVEHQHTESAPAQEETQ